MSQRDAQADIQPRRSLESNRIHNCVKNRGQYFERCLITRADDSHWSKVFSGVSVRVCVCLSVCLHDKTKMAETTIVIN